MGAFGSKTTGCYSMETYFLPKAFNTGSKYNNRLPRTALVLGFMSLLCAQWLISSRCDAATLQPYRAVYTTRYKGMSADAVQTLTSTANGQFTLKRDVNSMFVKLYEQSEFQLQNNQLVISRYTYKRGGLARKQNIEQLFQWDKNNLHVTNNGSIHDVAIKPPLLDKLSYTEAIRMQLLSQAQLPKNISILFADRHHMKQYDFVVAAQEDVTVLAGKLRAVRLEKHDPEDNRHTLIWVAPQFDYLLIKLQQTDNDGSYELNLKTYEPAKTVQPGKQ
jgi:hypothetical protein